MQSLGNITLNIALAIYIIWFVPQIILNYKRRDTSGLSYLMAGVLCFGYAGDLIYGFGLHMPWQYRLATIIGLLSLAVQWYQFGRYSIVQWYKDHAYLGLNILYFTLLAGTFYILCQAHTRQYYDQIGILTNICWFSYMLPQIVKNYYRQSARGLSIVFVVLSIVLNCCDICSSWFLSWDYPSKIGAMLALAANLMLLLQVKYYAKQSTTIAGLANNRQQYSITHS